MVGGRDRTRRDETAGGVEVNWKLDSLGLC